MSHLPDIAATALTPATDISLETLASPVALKGGNLRLQAEIAPQATDISVETLASPVALKGGNLRLQAEIAPQATDISVETLASPCTSCGACCAHFRVSFYFGELESQPGGWVPIALTSKVNHFRAAMKGTESGACRCVALRGELGKPGVTCSIYPQRPSPCREFSAWDEDGRPSPNCQRLRTALGLPALEPRLPLSAQAI
jgi:Fe-S-cluster containining protein